MGKANTPAVYAVRRGRETGIFHNWWQVKPLVTGVPAEFKRFKNTEDAQAYIDAPLKRIAPEEAIRISSDGSYGDDCIGWGYVAHLGDMANEDTILHKDYGFVDCSTLPILKEMRNVAGELAAAYRGVQWARRYYKQILVRYDYTGIPGWAYKEWKAKTPMTKAWQLYASPLVEQGILFFQHVEAHVDEGNVIADALANKGRLMAKNPPEVAFLDTISISAEDIL